jgi:hypothetical protein
MPPSPLVNTTCYYVTVLMCKLKLKIKEKLKKVNNLGLVKMVYSAEQTGFIFEYYLKLAHLKISRNRDISK